MDGAANETRVCRACGCSDGAPCQQHRNVPEGTAVFSSFDGDLCMLCGFVLKNDPVYSEVLSARMETLGDVARYAQMDAFSLHDELFCGLAHVEDGKLDPAVYRARLLEYAAKCIDISEAIDMRLKEDGQ